LDFGKDKHDSHETNPGAAGLLRARALGPMRVTTAKMLTSHDSLRFWQEWYAGHHQWSSVRRHVLSGLYSSMLLKISRVLGPRSFS
jgi:hypothetical protein